jgi:hypothetical protein
MQREQDSKNYYLTRWISMLSPSKRVLNEYKDLVMKMVVDSANVQIVKAKYELLCDVEMLLGLIFINCHSFFRGGARFL